MKEFKSKYQNNILIRDYEKLDMGFILSCEAIAQTFSAEGKFGLVDNHNDPPFLSKDGNNLLQRIRFQDVTMNFGALLSIQGAANTLRKAADGTTGTCILQMNYLKNFKRKNWNKKVEQGVMLGVEEVYKEIDKLARKATRADLQRIATTSCNNNEEMGALIMQAFDFAGDGNIEVIQNPNKETTTVLEQTGMTLDSGFASPFLSNTSKITFEATDCAIFCASIWNKNPLVIQHIKDFYQKHGKSQPLVLITERPSSDMKDTLIEFKKIGINISMIGLTAYTEHENVTLLEDIALLTGAKIFDPSVQNEEIVFGMADNIVIRDASTSITVGDVPSAVKDLVKELDSQDNKDNRVLARLKRLRGKASLIEVGSLTPSKLKEVFDSYEDGVASVKSTIADGYCSGGGNTFLYISKRMNTKFDNPEVQKGYLLVKKTIKSTFYQLLKNSNRRQSVIPFFGKNYEKLCSETYGISYNAKLDEIVDLFETGVVDSVKAIKTSLESATSVGINMFSIGTIIHFPHTTKE